MKLTLTLILFAVLAASAGSTYSQSARINLKMQDATLVDVFREIERTSEFGFFFKTEEIDLNKRVSLDLHNVLIEEVLKKILIDNYDYRILDKNIVVTRGNFNTTEAQQGKLVNGKVTDSSGASLPGVSVVVKGTTIGVITDNDGKYSLSNIPEKGIMQFSFVGMAQQEITLNGQSVIDVTMHETALGLNEIVVVGYGNQKKSDVTGAVSSLGKERLELFPNLTISQALQGAIAGVMMQTSSAGAVPNENIMIRGRNSIKASNSPLIVVDGIPYGGQLQDINPNDVKSIEILKDASAASIYGSRGANGVILVTTKAGMDGKPKIAYDGNYSIQQFSNLPDLMDGKEFYEFKMQREPDAITPSEKQIYESGEWVDWLDLALRNGSSTQHNLSVSGGFNDTKYYISGGITDVKGLAVNDDYLRLTSRINLETKISNWLTIGTRTQLSFDDMSGIAPTWDSDQGVFWFNPLTKAYDENNKLTIYPWPEDPFFRNPLMGTLAKNINESFQVVTNNYAVIDLPFIQGLQYRINSGVRVRFLDRGTYYGKDTQIGLVNRGDAETIRSRYVNKTLENIVNYTREFGKHNIFFTGVYSFESTDESSNDLTASGFPHDFLSWYSSGQAELIKPEYTFNSTALISQMLRLNYSYDSRYLLTVTGRRDGYSGFGANTKWGVFPSVALGWNLSNESFFPAKDLIPILKLRASYGLNGNQAVGAYETISRLGERNMISATTTVPGYTPTKLGEDNLGWESTKTFNAGVDYGILNNRISGDLNYFRSNTTDLLLKRSISPVHGITSITQNIGETQNEGFEASVTSTNVSGKEFRWTTTANISTVKNKIISLYGKLDENGKEIDDISNEWFIGQPILINYGYMWGGVWQESEAEQAALYKTKPGYIKILDLDNDTLITSKDRTIIGQRDPKFMWGMNNSWTYKNLTLSVFIHGVHGVKKSNSLKTDAVGRGVRRNTTQKNWWTPENPNNEWFMNTLEAELQSGYTANNYEDASFIRIKDISLMYDFSKVLLKSYGFSKFNVYVTGRNLVTFTHWKGLDPELEGQRSIPLQKEFVFGLNIGF